jgi:vacuolar-type H+-ATPase subunit E/Vma4
MIEDAVKARDTILKQLSEEAGEKVSKRKAEIDVSVNSLYDKEVKYARQSAEAEIAIANVNAKKRVLKTRNEILESVMKDLRGKLIGFSKTDAYEDYLAGNLKECLKYAGHSDIKIYVTPRDHEKYLGVLKKAAPGAHIAEDGDAMIGGCKIANNKRGIFVDNSFQKKIELCLDELFIISELSV